MIILDIHSHNIESRRTDTIYNSIYPIKNALESDLYYSIGIHPWHIPKHIDWDHFKHTVQQTNILAIGEAGIDLIKSNGNLQQQYDVFKRQAKLAEELSKPLIIHMVKSQEHILKVHKEIRPNSPWIIHGFRGNKTQASQLTNKGLLLSFGEYYTNEALVEQKYVFVETDDSTLPIEKIIQNVTTATNRDFKDILHEIQQNSQRIFFNEVACSNKESYFCVNRKL